MHFSSDQSGHTLVCNPNKVKFLYIIIVKGLVHDQSVCSLSEVATTFENGVTGREEIWRSENHRIIQVKKDP